MSEIAVIRKIRSILIDAKKTRQTVIKNTFWVAVSDFSGKLVRTGLIIYVARFLGAQNYGKFTFALAFTSVFVSFLDLGLATIITREFAKDNRNERHLPALIALKIALSAATTVAVIGLSFFVSPDFEVRAVIWLMAVFSAVSQFPEIMYAFSRARQKMEFEAAAGFGQVLLIAVCVVLALKISPTVIGISVAYCAAAVISLAALAMAFTSVFRPVEARIDTAVWKRYLAEAWPLALISLFSMIYSYIDSIILGMMGMIKQTGWYNAALKIVYVISAPASFVAAAFYPVFSKYARSNRGLQKIWEMQSNIIFMVSVPVILGAYMLAPQIIALLYGPDFTPAVPAFRILTVMVGIVFFTTPFSNLLIALRMQKKMFWITLSGCGVNVALNLLLIPQYGFYGSAAASVFTYLAILIIYCFLIVRNTRIKLLSARVLGSLLLALIAGFIMSAVVSFSFFDPAQVILRIAAGVAAYAVFIAFFSNPFQALIASAQARK